MWVDSIPVYRIEIESPLSAQALLNNPINSKLVGICSHCLLATACFVYESPNVEKNEERVFKASLDWT